MLSRSILVRVLSSLLCISSSVTAAANQKLLSEDILSEKIAREKLDPLLSTVKKIHTEDIEFLVKKGWWDLASEIVANAHKQKTDLSVSVRKAVKAVRSRADELIRTLNPKYFEKKQVIPVFRWSQDDSRIYITIKYSVKWDAPGAVNVKDPTVTMTDGKFSFRATGEHSGNKYEYMLDLDCFDKIDEAESTWSAASVGRFTAVIAKKRSRKWPRLLLDKKIKGTGRLDLTRQEEFDRDALSGVPAVSQSERTCAAVGKLYCPVKDICVANCSECPENPQPKTDFCSGPPKKNVQSITFNDTDHRQGFVGGDVVISQQKSEYDINQYYVRVGKTKKNEADRNQSNMGDVIGIVKADTRGKDVSYTLKDIPKMELGEDESMAISVVSENDFGLHNDAVYKLFNDAYLPATGPISMTFEDTDGEPNHIAGKLEVTFEDDPTIEEYSLYWGKKSGRRITTDAFIGSQRKGIFYTLENKSIPSGATHILAYAKNSHGENMDKLQMIPIVDNTKPCAGKNIKSSTNCPPSILEVTHNTSGDENILTLNINLKLPTEKQTRDNTLVVYASTGEKCNGESNYKLLDNYTVDKHPDGTTSIHLNETKLNNEGESWRYTHLQVFTQNQFGKSKYCSSVQFAEKKKEEL